MGFHVSTRIRLDEMLVRRGLAPSRARARDAVLRGCVRVDGKPVAKAGAQVAEDTAIDVDDPALRWVSRAALKLVAGLDTIGVDVAGKTCLDIGASTGGFTQVLLERGAAKVFAIDVGHGQLVPEIASDPRVVVREGLNARDLTSHDVPDPLDIIVSDVSFISLRLALPPALSLAKPDARLVALVKPQFEVGREAIGKGGLVRDPAQADAAAEDIATWLGREGWRPIGLVPSPIVGSDGNREFLIGAIKGGRDE